MFIMTAIFKDSKTKEQTLVFAESALIIAINGFDSAVWNVRNASTLLFSSLINHVFGVNRLKDEISKKNSLPGAAFFNRFPRLYQFFADIISESVISLKTNLNSKLFMVVTVLCHLYTLSDVASDQEALLHNYVPLLLK